MSIVFSSFLLFFTIITSFLATLTTSAALPALDPDEGMGIEESPFSKILIKSQSK